jgi:hypothetical protein
MAHELIHRTANDRGAYQNQEQGFSSGFVQQVRKGTKKLQNT